MRLIFSISFILLCGCGGQLRETEARDQASQVLKDYFKFELYDEWRLEKASGWATRFPRSQYEYFLVYNGSIGAREQILSEVDRRNREEARDLFGGVYKGFPDPVPRSSKAPWWNVEKHGTGSMAGLLAHGEKGSTATWYIYMFDEGTNCVFYSWIRVK